jgi:hypothetical protein
VPRNPGATRFRARSNGDAEHMTTNDESSTTEHHADVADEQRTRDEGAPGADAAWDSAPRGNPETDDEAVDKGEENLGRVVGR